MRLFSILAFLLCSSAAYSQSNSFATLGTTWQYDHGGLGWWGTVRYQVVSDTLFAGKLCRKITTHVTSEHWTNPGVVLSAYHAPVFIHEDNGIVYWWNKVAFDTLYNFNAQPGSSWKIHYPDSAFGCHTGLVTVDSITVDRFGNDSLRVFFVTITGSNFLDPARTVYAERLGGLFSLVPNPPPCAFDLDMVWGLRCFAEPGVPVVQFGTVPCELATGTPRPAPGGASLQLENPVYRQLSGFCAGCVDGYTIQVIDALGRLVMNEPVNQRFTRPLPAGLKGLAVVSLLNGGGSVVQRLKVVVD